MKLRKPKKLLGLLAGGFLLITGIGIYQAAMGNRSDSSLYDQTLAGEKVLFDQLHQFNIERFDRELAVNSMNEEQMIMIWKRMPKFRPFIEQKLKDAGLPTDIFYLVLAESALRETAVSSANAAGIWQFIPSTAKGYGLRVDEFIDERYHLEKATDAAIKYLKKAYEKFGNWTLAMAAYNRGSNGIANDMSYQYQSNFYDLYLNNETSRYIFRILAFKEIFENLKSYFDTSKRGGQYQVPATKDIQLGKTDDLAARAASQGYSYLELRSLNPRIRKNALPEGLRNIKVYQR
ncbi:MAG: lytic transglycosylase domain-containing protein [candidate division SR1 bacterium]|nr:MAG: lytic transglycosylase domain-containing protein [candidate division SR1 bacterium]